MNNNPTAGAADSTRPVASPINSTTGRDVQTSRATRHLSRRVRGRALAARQPSALRQDDLQTRLRLLEEELNAAYQMQSSLLPQTMPQLRGLDVFATSRPARYLGGDFYDFIGESEQGFAFSVGDVAGKGAAAALLMSILHQSIRTAAHLPQFQQPGDLLGHVNANLYETLAATKRFVTTFVGWYDQPSRELLYADAGHGIVLYCPYQQPAQRIPAQNLPLGIFSDTIYGSRTLKLNAGDLLVIATDGLPEASNASGELFGYERMKRTVEMFAAGSAEEIGYTLLNAVDRFRVNALGQVLPQEDDQTLLVIKQGASQKSGEHRRETADQGW